MMVCNDDFQEAGDAGCTDLAQGVVNRLISNQFAAVGDMFSPRLRAQLPADLLEDGWRATISATGDPHRVGSTVCTDTGDGIRIMSVPVTCRRGDITVLVSVDEKRSIVGLRLKHALQHNDWAPPAYVDVNQFAEHTVTVSAAGLAVTGALCIPTSASLAPAAILLAGSGPMDRNGTLGPNRPLQDFAWGLATRGIATLRYDKVTFAHPEHFSTNDDATLADEYIAHAHAALALLVDHPSIDTSRIFLAGHSLGGTVAPRIAAQSDAVAGLVILAGATELPHHAALRQIRYLAGLDPSIDVDTNPDIVRLAEQASRVDSLDPSSPPTPSDELLFGVPAAYWLDLRAYDCAGTAAKLNLPMLILQGGRDYQVTVRDDLWRWERALSDRSDVTITVYPTADHQFFSGQGPSTPSTYREPQHVDLDVVSDVATWIHRVDVGGDNTAPEQG